jgi:ABC-2 type transport system ATP-binding protein
VGSARAPRCAEGWFVLSVYRRVESKFYPWVDAFAGQIAKHGSMSEFDVVTVRGLRKSYGGRTVVDGIDLDVPAAEIVGLIGANGAGKTTVVECIQGLRRPDAGTLRVLGLDPLTQAERLRPLIGSQLQDSALPERLRVGEAVHLFSRDAGADRGNDLIEQFGLAQRRSSVFASLSGGERQRLFLVLALLNRPRLVILDELTQGLDPAARRNVWSAIEQLRVEGTTVLLVTHELDEAEALCDRVVAIRAGRVLDCGPPADLIARHGQRATICFTLPADAAASISPRTLQGLRGVHDVVYRAGQVSIRGDRTAIAHVGAALVGADWVPTDLSVHVPNLEDALLSLLEQADPDGDFASDRGGRVGDLTGSRR